MALLTGTLKVMDTIIALVVALWLTTSVVLGMLAGLGYIHYKWCIIAVGAPIVAVGVILSGLLIVLLFLGLAGAIDTDWKDLTKDDPDLVMYPTDFQGK